MYENELYHHGIKGMKWGVRRFQFKDGSLTGAGRKRYSDAEQNYRDAKAARKQANREHRKAFNKASTITGAYGKRSAEYNRASIEAAKKASKADANYKKAKAAYKAEKKAAANTPEAIAERRKKALKVGAAVAGTALAAYGTYKVAQYVQDKRNSAAMQKAQDYVDKNFLRKVGDASFKDGSVKTFYRDGQGTRITMNSARSKEIGQRNAKTISTARQMYKDATNTKLDRGLSKIVDAGDAVGNATRRGAQTVGNAAKRAAQPIGNAARSAKNKVLDVVNPIYETVEGPTNTTTRMLDNGARVTESVTNYYKRKVKRK